MLVCYGAKGLFTMLELRRYSDSPLTVPISFWCGLAVNMLVIYGLWNVAEKHKQFYVILFYIYIQKCFGYVVKTNIYMATCCSENPYCSPFSVTLFTCIPTFSYRSKTEIGELAIIQSNTN